MAFSKELLLFKSSLLRAMAQRLDEAAHGRITPRGVLELVLVTAVYEQADLASLSGISDAQVAEIGWNEVLALLAMYEQRIDLFNALLLDYGAIVGAVDEAWIAQQGATERRIKKFLHMLPGWEDARSSFTNSS